MTLLKHENQFWPFAVMMASGEATFDQHLTSLKAWDQWFDRAQPFHVIRVYLDESSLRHPDGAAQATQQWMSEGAAEKMRRLVQSMLIVVPPAQYPRMQKMSVRKAFGIPGGLFSSLDDAYAWLDNPPEAVAGLPITANVLANARHYVQGIVEKYNANTAITQGESSNSY